MLHVHFVAVAGTGMGALAALLRAQGHRVTGSDEAIYPPMSDVLERSGVPVSEGFDAERLLADRPDLAVIGNVVRRENPEARAILEHGIAYRSLPDALREFAIRDRHSVVVAGTHGKTTTTSLIATLLLESGRDPSALVGGVARNLEGSFREGDGEHFVVEGDEYDTAFFDKTPKFLHYAARTAVVTSIEFDHADIYADVAAVEQAFAGLVGGLPADGTLVANLGDPRVAALAGRAPCRVVGYALGADPPLEREIASRFALYGRHYLANALAAIATARALGVSRGDALDALRRYRGVARRLEVRGDVAGVRVIDDFAHHPTAVRETVAAVAAHHRGRRIVAVFEPRSNTSRRAVFQEAYAEAFAGAARVLLSRVDDRPIYSATGEVRERLSSDRLAADLVGQGVEASAHADPDEILAALGRELRPGDVVLVMSNGAFGHLCARLVEALGASAA